MATTLEHWAPGAGVGYTWTACTGSADLTSLTSAYSVLASSTAIANQTAQDVFCDLSVSIPSITTVAPAYLGVYMYPLNEDGSTYGDGQFTAGTGAAAIPGAQYFKGSIFMPVGTQACVGSVTGLVMPPGTFLFLFQNNLGVATSSSAGTAKFRTYCLGLG